MEGALPSLGRAEPRQRRSRAFVSEEGSGAAHLGAWTLYRWAYGGRRATLVAVGGSPGIELGCAAKLDVEADLAGLAWWQRLALVWTQPMSAQPSVRRPATVRLVVANVESNVPVTAPCESQIPGRPVACAAGLTIPNTGPCALN